MLVPTKNYGVFTSKLFHRPSFLIRLLGFCGSDDHFLIAPSASWGGWNGSSWMPGTSDRARSRLLHDNTSAIVLSDPGTCRTLKLILYLSATSIADLRMGLYASDTHKELKMSTVLVLSVYMTSVFVSMLSLMTLWNAEHTHRASKNNMTSLGASKSMGQWYPMPRSEALLHLPPLGPSPSSLVGGPCQISPCDLPSNSGHCKWCCWPKFWCSLFAFLSSLHIDWIGQV